MSNTNLPPSYDDLVNRVQRLEEALDRNAEVVGTANRLRNNVVASLKSVRGSLENFVNPVNNLTNSIRKMDKTNREALKLGTTNEKLTKFVSKNNDILGRNNVSLQKLQESIISGFGKGVREQTDSMLTLTEEMIATGQNTEMLNQMNSNLVLFTGNNTKVLDNASKVNKEVSDKYGVSNEKLIQTVNNLASVMEQASFFGTEAVNSLNQVATEIAGRVGGTANDPAIRTLLSLATGGLENVATASILGARGVRGNIAGGGGATTADFEAILDNLTNLVDQSGGGEFGLDIAAARTQLSKSQVAQLVNLNKMMKQDFKLNEETKATEDERYNNLQNVQERAVNFYDRTAMGMLALLGTINTQVLFLASQAGMVGGGIGPLFGGSRAGPDIDPATGTVRSRPLSPSVRGRGFKFSPKLGLGTGAAAIGANMLLGGVAEESGFGNTLNYASMGASLGAFGGPMGAAIGGGLGLLAGGIMDIANYSERTAKATEEQLKKEKEKEQRERAEKNAQERSRLEFMANYIRSRTDMSDPEQRDLMRGMASSMRRVAEREERESLNRDR